MRIDSSSPDRPNRALQPKLTAPLEDFSPNYIRPQAVAQGCGLQIRSHRGALCRSLGVYQNRRHTGKKQCNRHGALREFLSGSHSPAWRLWGLVGGTRHGGGGGRQPGLQHRGFVRLQPRQHASLLQRELRPPSVVTFRSLHIIPDTSPAFASCGLSREGSAGLAQLWECNLALPFLAQSAAAQGEQPPPLGAEQLQQLQQEQQDPPL